MPGATPPDPFDLWLKASVHRRFDAVLAERVPEDLLRLASDSRTEWEEMKARWQGRDEGGDGGAGGDGA